VPDIRTRRGSASSRQIVSEVGAFIMSPLRGPAGSECRGDFVRLPAARAAGRVNLINLDWPGVPDRYPPRQKDALVSSSYGVSPTSLCAGSLGSVTQGKRRAAMWRPL